MLQVAGACITGSRLARPGGVPGTPRRRTRSSSSTELLDEHHLVEALHEVTLFDLHEAVACDEHGRLNHSEIHLGTTTRSRRTRSSSSNALTCPGRLRAGRVAELGAGAARCKLVACVVRHGGRLPDEDERLLVGDRPAAYGVHGVRSPGMSDYDDQEELNVQEDEEREREYQERHEDDEAARSQDEQDRQDEAEGGYTEDDHFGDNDPEERQLEFEIPKNGS